MTSDNCGNYRQTSRLRVLYPSRSCLPNKFFEDIMDKQELLRTLQRVILRHHFYTFVDEPPSMAQGGRGIACPGCVACKKKIFTMPQFMEHLTYDVLPKIIQQ